MIYTDFNLKQHGFAGHMAEPEEKNRHKAVIVLMGGEKSILPGIKIAERFADFGFVGLSVSLFGTDGLPDGVDRIPLEIVESAVAYLQNERSITDISVYGISMGSIFAALAAQYMDGIHNVVLCSPSHVSFQGTQRDKKTMTGHSMVTWKGQELPYIKQDFSEGGMAFRVFREFSLSAAGEWSLSKGIQKAYLSKCQSPHWYDAESKKK